jgi:uncharacterized membrane protein
MTHLAPEIAEQLLKKGNFALWGKRYEEAIAALEAYCKGAEPDDRQYLQAQMWLLKAYQASGKTEAAIALCQQLLQSPETSTRLWGQNFLAVLQPESVGTAPEVAPEIASEARPGAAPEPEDLQEAIEPSIQLKTVEEVHQFYTKVLLPDLKKIEAQRQVTLHANLAVASLIILVVLVLFMVLVAKNLRALTTEAASVVDSFLQLLPVFGFCFALLMGLWVWVAFFCYTVEIYERGFKAKVIQKLITFIDHNQVLKYSRGANSSNTLREFVASRIFQVQPNKIIQDDAIAGQIGKTKIYFSEICAEAEARSDSGIYSVVDLSEGSPVDAGFVFFFSLMVRAFRGCLYILNRLLRGQRINLDHFKSDILGNQVRRHVFKGLFLIADFNKSFQGHTLVIPDYTERYLGYLAQDLQALNSQRGELIRLEDPEFERLFAVYSNDQIEARYILSTSLMQQLVDFTKKAKRHIFISFINDKIYMAIQYDEDLFEPKLFQSMVDFTPVREYFETLQLMMGVVEDLNLNRRVWTKQ